MGLYPAPPAKKFETDIDGTVGFYVDQAGTPRALTTGEMERLSAESSGSSNMIGAWVTGTTYWGFIFPQLRSLAGYFYDIELQTGASISVGNIQCSDDTITGADGTWTTIETMQGGHGPTGNSTGSGGFLIAKPFYRTVRALSIASCKAVRVAATGGSTGHRYLGALHIYGDLVAGQTPNRLRLWHPTLDQELSATQFNYDDIARLSITDKQFRVKNNSATLTATNISIVESARTDNTSPTMLSALSWSHPDTPSVFDSIAIISASLAPGAISGIVTLRMAPSSTSPLGLWRQRIKATAASWA